ncbi:amino acid ABC transporter permease [Epibacterium ulvae]|uniref:amino acid ABC transporter permease n=1 Tax=Epibacterium ulvae TaxID=1156985 RepID=UPI001BFC9837|nr:amino acid ABC transporter permease [Epibacterium ulvae]MBT8153902.1 amino acid ABC transporter permease [Epibacterium ulvae]
MNGNPAARLPARLIAGLFGDSVRSIITVLMALLIIFVGPGLLNWLLLDATWSGSAEDCRANGGACWAFIGVKLNQIIFGAYPTPELWRPILFLALLVVIANYAYQRPRQIRNVIFALIGAMILGVVLMRGGVFGMTQVDNARWGGLPITMIVTLAGMGCAFPLGVLLMLGGASNNPGLRIPCRLYVDIVRGIPAITLVFMTFAIIPLLMPQGMMIDKLQRAALGLTFLTAAYVAEALRGALEALPAGQREASAALGLGYWRTQALIILPQVIANSMQPLANIAIAFVKNTSLLIIIGLFDLLGAARSSLFDGDWQGFYRELYLFVGFIYLVICLFLEAYVAKIETERRARIYR